MTTQHLHHEHNEADTSVVEHQATPETTLDATPASSVTPAEAQEEANPPSSTHVSPAVAAEETTGAQSTQPEPPVEAANETTPASTATPETTGESATPALQANAQTTTPSPTASEPIETVVQAEPALQAVAEQPETPAPETTAPGAETAASSPAQPAAQEEATPGVDAQSLLTSSAEEVRPFTDFIEEFRQAEATRLQAEEAFALLSSVETTLPATSEVSIAATEFKVESLITTPPPAVVQEAQTTPEAATLEAPAVEEPPAKEKPARAVSPLLRPPSRLRVPRHSRHQAREEQAAAAAPDQPTPPAPEEAAPPAPPVEPAAEGETTPPPSPKPRRYRFDRPAATTQANGTTPASAASTTPVSEPQPPAQAKAALAPEVVPDSTGTNGATPAAPAASEGGRRRHSQKEKEKEQPAAQAPAPVQSPAPAPEPVVAPEAVEQPAEVAPEDLPPLEYSELRKASTRRRRRRGSSAAASITPPVTPPLPTPQPPPLSLPPLPSTPAAPQTSTPNYSIVSGYTLNQMNLGNELNGPFMGPEPSPARGSVLSRDGRTTQRAETQRTPTHIPTPHNRGDGGLSSAALAQLTNAVTQALQLQTDRMVAELRRYNQTPTNVTVSLPPFPSTERVGVFVDVANLLYSARTLRIAVDFGKLLDFLRGNRRLVRAHAYCPTSPQAGEEQMFLQAVKGLGYRITTKNYKTFSSGAKKADLDLDLCMDVVRLVEGRAVDCIVLVSGDSDFMPMLDYCSDHGVRVEVAAFDEAMSATLRQSCDLFVNLSMLEEIRA